MRSARTWLGTIDKKSITDQQRMTNPTVFMFSGQGSHHYQMGRELFERDLTFRESLSYLDSIVRDRCGYSVLSSLYHQSRTKADPFDHILVTSPAIFMVEIALADTLIRRGITPDYVLGASLGTFAAAVVAGYVTREEALMAVLKQSSTIEMCCQRGCMIAIIGDTELYHDQPSLADSSEIAAINSRSHFVLAARETASVSIEASLRNKQIAFRRLFVRYAFHSRWIDEAKIPLVSHFQALSYKTPEVPMICCADACFLSWVPKDYFWTVTRVPIRVDNTIAFVESTGQFRYVDVGPSGSLANIVKHALPSTSRSKVFTVLTPWGSDWYHLARLIRNES